MKKSLFITLLLIANCACSKIENQGSEDNKSQYVNVKLNVIQESIDMSYEPLRSTTEERTYAINVYQLNPNTNAYEYYCCGVFDNVNNLSISFQKGYKYKLHTAMFVNYFDQYNFNIDNNLQQEIIRLSYAPNTFYYDTSFIYDLDYNYYLLADKEYSRAIRPNIDSFHSIKEGYEPSDNDTLNITLKRSSFGVTINVNGLEGGSINTTLRTQKYYNYIQPEINITYPDNTYSGIYTMLNPLDDFDTMDVNIIYTNEDGETTVLVREDAFKFSKNVRTIFNINLNKNTDNSSNANISINIDSTAFTDTTHEYNCTVK